MATGTKRNRTYYAGDLRRDLMAAALVSIEEAGLAQVSLRDLARRLGVSHAAPKNHFPDKRALFTALATEAHQLLGRALEDGVAAAATSDPLARLMATGRAYLGFAREHPAHFAVMWREDLQDRADPELTEATARTLGVVVELASQIDGGALAGRDPTTVALLAWSVAHGIADLSAGGALDDVPGHDDPRSHDEDLLGLLEAVLRQATSGG